MLAPLLWALAAARVVLCVADVEQRLRDLEHIASQWQDSLDVLRRDVFINERVGASHLSPPSTCVHRALQSLNFETAAPDVGAMRGAATIEVCWSTWPLPRSPLMDIAGVRSCVLGRAGEAASQDDPHRLVVARPKVSWPHIMEFVVAIRPTRPITALHMGSEIESRGKPGHFLVGDDSGSISVFGFDGAIIGHHQTQESSPVTALAELRFRCCFQQPPDLALLVSVQRALSCHRTAGHPGSSVCAS